MPAATARSTSARAKERSNERDAERAAEPRWLDDLEQSAWRAFIETQGDLLTAIDADLAAIGLSLGDYQVMVYLSEAPGGSMRMCDLAAMLHLSPSGLTRRLDGLVRSGWVARRSSEHDRRVMLAELTPQGRARLESAAPAHVRSVRSRLIDLLDRDDLAALTRIFDRVADALAGRARDEPR